MTNELKRLKDQDDLACIFEEILTSMTMKEFAAFESFDDFMAWEDTRQGYEEEWTPEARAELLPLYEKVYMALLVFCEVDK